MGHHEKVKGDDSCMAWWRCALCNARPQRRFRSDSTKARANKRLRRIERRRLSELIEE